jgi:FdrA protein
MTTTKFDVRRGAYYDSVVLMELQRGLLALPGVLDAGMAMASQANCDLLSANNLLPESISASPDDLLIVVKAENEFSATDAMDEIDTLLAKRRSSLAEDFRPRSLRAAVKQLPEAGWVLVSVPGRYAAEVAREGLALGKHVFLYSDNVSLKDEIELKTAARDKGLLVMGPDCGTAIINGVGLGFANRIRRGKIGIVGASGTGTQAVTVQIHNLGGGISHALGTGGRDLKSEIGAITARQALDFLSQDEETKVIVLISKPPSPEMATELIASAQGSRKPAVVYFIGYAPPARKVGNLHFAINVYETAEIAVGLSTQIAPLPLMAEKRFEGYVRGLFSGGTLAYETLLGLQSFLSPIFSNAPISNQQTLKDPLRSEAHTILDLGDEFFMVGRLHPMIDNDLRIRRIKQESSVPEVGLILLDVVLGEGSYPDPARELAPAIRGAHEKGLPVVSIVIGTEDDPQDLDAQIKTLQEAGSLVFRTVTEAVEYICICHQRGESNSYRKVNPDLGSQSFAAINIGLESFHESLISQGAQAIQVDWRPPAGGNEKLASLLARMKK